MLLGWELFLGNKTNAGSTNTEFNKSFNLKSEIIQSGLNEYFNIYISTSLKMSSMCFGPDNILKIAPAYIDCCEDIEEQSFYNDRSQD